MEKYSKEWKLKHAEGWAQYHKTEKVWKNHWVQYDTEYSTGSFLTKREAEEAL